MASIYKRGKVWYSKLIHNGEQIRKPLSTDKAVALKMLSDLKADIKTDKYGAQTNDWTQFKTNYLDWSRANKKPGTQRWDTLAIRYLEEFKPIKRLSEITPLFLDEFKTHLKLKNEQLIADRNKKAKTAHKQDCRRQGLAEHGLNRVIMCIKTMMRKAEGWNLIAKQSWNTVSKYKTARGRVDFFTPQEVALLLKQAALQAKNNASKYSPWTTVILLGARAGLRRGEMHNLMWSDVDFTKRILSVTVKKDWTPKDYEERDIPLPEDLYQHLKAIPRKGDYVLYDSYGARFSIDSLTTYFRDKIVRKAGLEGNVHKLRHTYASHLVQGGADLYVVSKLLGHSSITTTEIYAHLRPVDLSKTVNLLPAIKR